jgi:crotonobetainyl-CoA:carnitine CoA-transferase CaiB-like acyl-CoA transferase
MSQAQPLRGIRVVEFSHMIMGPTCGMILADLGADVIKIEPTPKGDNTRRLNGSGAGFFPTYNRNKRSIMLDLKASGGMEIAKRLIADADVLIENFRPGALDKLGLGYDALGREHEGLIYCSLKGFLAGPYEHRAALDEVVQMMGGLAYMTGPPGRPLRAGASVNDVMGGMFAAIAILAALNERQTTGKGRLVRSSLFENNIFLVAQHMMQFLVTGQAAAPLPVRLSAWAVYDLFDTADGEQIFVGVVSDTQWRIFCDAFGLADFRDDPDLATNYQRVATRDRFMPTIRDIFRKLTLAEALSTCEGMGLPFAPITRPEDLFDDPHLNQPGGMLDVTLPDGRPARVPSLPMEFSGERLGVRLDIPRAGEHGPEIVRDLGFTQDQVEALIAKGVLGVDSSRDRKISSDELTRAE